MMWPDDFKPVKVVAVKDAKVRDPEWREKLKEWADLMEDRFQKPETPVGPIVTREWIEYVEELESKVETLESELNTDSDRAGGD